MFNENIKLVYMALKKFDGNKDDLLQCGYQGLLDASRNFDPKKGYKFSTFALKHIIGNMKKEIKNNYPIKINPIIFEIINYISNKEFKVLEVAKYFKVSKRMVLEALSYKGLTIFDESLYMKEDEFSKYLEYLEEDERRIVLLKYKHNLYEKDIAKLLNVSQSTVSRKLKGALIKLIEVV